MGQHKYNPTAIAAREGKLPPKKPEWEWDELYQAMTPEIRKKTALLAATMAAMSLSDYKETENG